MKRKARPAADFDPLEYLTPREQLEALGPRGLPAAVEAAFVKLEFTEGAEEPARVIREFIERKILWPQAQRRLKRTKRPSNDELRREWRRSLAECQNSVDAAAQLMAERHQVHPRTIHKWRKDVGIT